MKAAVFFGALDVRVEDVPAVDAPHAGEVVIDVIRAGICGTDATEYAVGPKMAPLHHRHLASGHEGPVILGHEFVGVVREVGDGVTSLRPGERVVPGAGAWCGRCDRCLEGRTNLCPDRYLVGMHRDGGLAESVAVPAVMCMPVDDACSDDAAAMAQPLAVALHGLRRAGVEGASVAVIGAGGIGSFVIAAAKLQGVAPLIAIDISRARLRTATALGADHVFDALDPRLTDRIRELTGGYGPDVVIEASGAPPSPQLAASLVRAGGRVGLMGMQSQPTELDLFSLAQWEVDVVPSNAHVCAEDLPKALELLTTTDFADRVLGDRIALDRLVPEGLVPLAEGTAEGKILIDLAAA